MPYTQQIPQEGKFKVIIEELSDTAIVTINKDQITLEKNWEANGGEPIHTLLQVSTREFFELNNITSYHKISS